jgi:flagellar biosynthetic protein FliR
MYHRNDRFVMSLAHALQLVPTFVLAFFRIAGVMVSAPLFGSARVPRRLKVLFALVIAAAIAPTLKTFTLPESAWKLAAGIGGELLFGIAIGTALSFTFVAVNWAGEIIGQQMGLGIGQVFDPHFGGSGSVMGDLYFFLTLVIFLIVGGHLSFLKGVRESFDALPLLSVSMNQNLLDLVTALLQSATALALQLAAPMLVTMLLTDVVLGFIGKTIPQINVMTLGLPLRSLVGMVVLIFGLMMCSRVIQDSMLDAVKQVANAFAGGLT